MDPNTGKIFESAYELEKPSEVVERFNDAIDAVKAVLVEIPDGRAKSLALTKLDECVLWTTQALGNRQQRRGHDLQPAEVLESLRNKYEPLKEDFKPEVFSREGFAPTGSASGTAD